MALAAFPLGSQRRGGGGSSHGAADAGAEARAEVSALAGNERAETGQCGPELPEVLHGAAVLLLQKEAAAERARYQTMPLGRVAAREGAAVRRLALRQADWAAGWMRSTGRPSSDSERRHGTLADELGPLQILAAALQVRFRAEVAERRFDDAIRTAKTMFALARHLGEHPTEVADLVGLWSPISASARWKRWCSSRDVPTFTGR